MVTGALITQPYLEEQRRLHADPRGYGGRGRKWAPQVIALAEACGGASVLDYGCGQGSLAAALAGQPAVLRIAEYDPAIPGKDGRPSFADVVVCTDVMEHVEAAYLDEVIEHLATLTRRRLLLVISLVPTAKTLSTGEQAHVSLHDVAYWRAAFERRFAIVEELSIKPDKQWAVICRPLGGVVVPVVA